MCMYLPTLVHIFTNLQTHTNTWSGEGGGDIRLQAPKKLINNPRT